jgi:hypothetical protein
MIPGGRSLPQAVRALTMRCRLLLLRDGEVNEVAHDPHAECHVEGRSMPFSWQGGLLCERLVN